MMFFLKTSRQFDVSEQVIIDSFLINGVVGILPKELSKKLLNYHQQSYIYNAPVFQFDKTSEKGIFVSCQKTLLPCGVVALLLGYSIKKANKVHSPETSFGGFTSISEVAQELCRILNIFCEPITGSLKTLEKVTESLIFNEDVKNPQSISTILTPKVKVPLVCLFCRTNL